MTPFRALTLYGARIVGASFATREEAAAWAADQGDAWPGSRIVQTLADGRERTIWRHQPERAAA